MIVHGIQVPRVRAASLALQVGVQVRAASLARTHQVRVRVGSQARTITLTSTVGMTIGYLLLTQSSSGILHQTERVGRVILIVSYVLEL